MTVALQENDIDHVSPDVSQWGYQNMPAWNRTDSLVEGHKIRFRNAPCLISVHGDV